LDNEIKNTNFKVLGNSVQITTISNICDENLKSINRLNEGNDKMRTNSDNISEKLHKINNHIDKFSQDLLKLNDFEKDIKVNFLKIEQNNKSLNDFNYSTNKKFSEIDATVLDLLHSISDLSRFRSELYEKNNNNDINYNSNNETGNSNINQINSGTLEQLSKLNKEMENLKKLNREFNDRLERQNRNISETEKLVNDISEIQSKINHINGGETDMKDISISEKINEIERKLKDRENLEKEDENNKNHITEQILKIHDTIKNLTNISNSKASKDDIERLSKIINSEMEKTNNKLIEQIKGFDVKLKNSMQLNSTMLTNSNFNKQSPKKKNTIDSRENDVYFNEILKQFSINELPIKIKEQICIDNEFLKELVDMIKDNTLKLDIANKNFNDFKIKFNDDYILSLFQEKIADLILRINENKEGLTKLKNCSDERFKEIEGIGIHIEEELYDVNLFGINIANNDKQKNNQENKDNKKVENKNHKKNESIDDSQINSVVETPSLKEILRLSLIIMKKNYLLVEKVTQRQENMNNDILSKIKKDLSQESGKILDEFRGDLKFSINKIEDQLREKVDRFSLDEFGRRVDTKLNTEINKKIDRSDLKKNNNIINKKIDTLENKISKTLVDTLIDLQMEEMPLITKQSVNGKKCASCNQFMQDPKLGVSTYQTFYNNTSTQNHAHNDEEFRNFSTQTKFKFRNIQDNSNKYGTGSYSRFLNNVDNVGEEIYAINNIKTNKNITFANGFLPEIGNNFNSAKILNKKNQNLYNNSLNSMSSTILNSNGNLNTNTNNNSSGNINKIRIDDLAEKQLNSLINEELEKKIINPENLIKNANKVFDNVEKRNAAANFNK